MNRHKFSIYMLLLAPLAFGQVAIGKTSVANTSVSLDFYSNADNVRGMLLPWASTVASNPDATYTGLSGVVNGTLVFDVSDDKVKYLKNGTWFDLTVKSRTDVVPGITNVTVDLSAQGSTLQDKPVAKAVIGANGATDTTPGILVLSDSDKAMVLPKVANPQTTIQNPSAGMMVYDTAKRLFCVFNGTVWTFWRP